MKKMVGIRKIASLNNRPLCSSVLSAKKIDDGIPNRRNEEPQSNEWCEYPLAGEEQTGKEDNEDHGLLFLIQWNTHRRSPAEKEDKALCGYQKYALRKIEKRNPAVAGLAFAEWFF